MSDPSDRAPPTADDARVTVVLVHGLLRTQRSLHRLAQALDGAGFRVERFGYSSTRGAIADHGHRLAAELRRLAAERPAGAIHVVGHSLGNLVVRAALHGAAPPRVRRV
ncbi:MAG: alpha/beta hydrolase, partial [Planctomycetes bacterium]|nr:alpha/beta hydrolase [Planctomycetota bacterium]